MRRRFRRKPKKVVKVPTLRANDRIRIDPVTLVEPDGTHHASIALADAKAIAAKHGLDLVEVSPKLSPPVCKILDYGKHQYTATKQMRQQQAQQKRVDTKGIRIGIRTDVHDLEFKKKQAEKFLSKGNKVKAEIILRGREKAHQDLARENIQSFLDMIEIPYKVEEPIKRFPQGFNTIIAPE